MTNSHQLGRVGEHYAVYRLEKAGIEAIRIDREDVDLWAKLPNKKIISVQVKSSREFNFKNRTPHFRFYFRKRKSTYRSADISICVGINAETNLVCIEDNFEHEARRDIRINKNFFNKETEEESIQRLITNNPLKHIRQDKLA